MSARTSAADGVQPAARLVAGDPDLGDVEQRQQHIGPQPGPHSEHRNVLLRYWEGDVVTGQPGQTMRLQLAVGVEAEAAAVAPDAAHLEATERVPRGCAARC